MVDGKVYVYGPLSRFSNGAGRHSLDWLGVDWTLLLVCVGRYCSCLKKSDA